MNKRHSEVAMVVGEEMADELREHFKKLEIENFARPILYDIGNETVEFLDRPRKHLTAFECEYCRNTFVVDLLDQMANCPGCNHGAPYEAVLLALNPIQQIAEIQGKFDPMEGGVAYPPISGSHPHPDAVRFAYPPAYSFGFYEPPLIPEPYPRVGAWNGELITNENRERIHKEMLEEYKRYELP